jgi:four helix bundle protein
MSKQDDLEDRTFLFAQHVRAFTKAIPADTQNQEDARQLIRASGSVGANYIEANEALSKRDFLMRIKISRKESKECRFFLRLVDAGEDLVLTQEQSRLIQEAQELTNIFGAIVRKCESAG